MAKRIAAVGPDPLRLENSVSGQRVEISDEAPPRSMLSDIAEEVDVDPAADDGGSLGQPDVLAGRLEPGHQEITEGRRDQRRVRHRPARGPPPAAAPRRTSGTPSLRSAISLTTASARSVVPMDLIMRCRSDTASGLSSILVTLGACFPSHELGPGGQDEKQSRRRVIDYPLDHFQRGRFRPMEILDQARPGVRRRPGRSTTT